MAEPTKQAEEAPLQKPVPKWWRPFRLFGRTLMFLFFVVIVAAPVVAVVELWDEISSPTATYDFFGVQMPVWVIAAIVAALCFTLGTFGLLKSIEMIVKAIKKVRFKLTWKPIVSALALLGIVLAAFFYYVPFWYLYLGIKPTFGPHLAIHGAGGMQVSWDTSSPAQSLVKWGTSPSALVNEKLGGEFYWQANQPDSHHHCVLLDGLVPGQKYYYTVPSLGSAVHSFTSPPSLLSGERVTFTILGDTQGAFNVQQQNIANMVSRLGVDGIDFTIICGDNVNRDDNIGEWAMLYDSRSYGRIISQVPWMATSGNHETSSDADDWPMRKNFKTFHQNSYHTNGAALPPGARDIGIFYSFNYSNVHFTLLDTHQLDGTNNLSSAQLAFLEADLASVNSTAMWKFVTFHVPMYSTSVRGGSKAEEDLAAQLEPILFKYQVDAVFYGHDHIFEAWHVNATAPYGGTYAFLVAGGGGSLKDIMDPDEHTHPAHAWESYTNVVSDYTDGRYDDIYGHEWQLYGERTFHYMVVDVVGNQTTFSAYRTGDNSLIVSYTKNL
ncbi:MAG: metallophosphoesterase family protein [Candidatus Lokiarchaeota archaeon]|nr:metallophosphoesterase family protein [Candidatus Lokiarchaeota archaeon]